MALSFAVSPFWLFCFVLVLVLFLFCFVVVRLCFYGYSYPKLLS